MYAKEFENNHFDSSRYDMDRYQFAEAYHQHKLESVSEEDIEGLAHEIQESIYMNNHQTYHEEKQALVPIIKQWLLNHLKK